MLNDQFSALVSSVLNNTNLHKLGASGGTKLWADTSAHTVLNGSSFSVREATVVASMSGVDTNGVAVNFITEFNISGANLIAGDLFIAPSGYRIVSFQLSSGSILMYS